MTLLVEAAATPRAIGAVFALAWALTAWRDWVRCEVPPRRDGRIPAEERRLLGDDWRDCVWRRSR